MRKRSKITANLQEIMSKCIIQAGHLLGIIVHTKFSAVSATAGDFNSVEIVRFVADMSQDLMLIFDGVIGKLLFVPGLHDHCTIIKSAVQHWCTHRTRRTLRLTHSCTVT